MADAEFKNARLKRRGAKAALTRHGKALMILIEGKRPVDEVKELVKKIQQSFEDLERKHTEFTQMIEDDEAFEIEEQWLEECQKMFLDCTHMSTDYVEAAGSDSSSGINEVSSVQENDEVINEMEQLDIDRVDASPNDNHPPTENDTTEPNVLTDANNSVEEPSPRNNQSDNGRSRIFAMEKPKLPKFAGDVREYYIFRADFKHLIESRYSRRDSAAILRSSLQGKPLEMIRGLGEDYEAAWNYLDSIYGDPRFVADTITQDLNKFKALREGEDARFCELTHLVNRSFNTLKEAGRPYDMDNNHVIALIEQKMYVEDRKVWFRHLDSGDGQATLKKLMDWMTTEMKSRMRATSQLRSGPTRSAVSHVSKVEVSKQQVYKCWLCQSSSHWMDQCEKLKNMKPEERLNLMKENHACFSCLKKAGKDHRSSNCTRKRQCPESVNGKQCKFYHHPMLHTRHNSNTVVVTSVSDNKEAMLPTVQVNVVGPEFTSERRNLLLDSGAQISLIKSSLAENLKLKGKDITITISKVGGDEEELMTKLYSVRIRSLEDNSTHYVNAVGMECINNEIGRVRINEIAGKFGIPRDKLRRGRGSVDILIGIDHAKMHGGETRQFGNMMARRTPLGWVVFGAVPGQQADVNRILHVKLSKPVNMSDFWTTEEMGVNVPRCHCKEDKLSHVEREEAKIIEDSCRKVGDQWMIPYPWQKDPNLLPNNIIQAERKLEAIERRLQRNTELAKVYDNQMKAMVDMKFARKLSEEEMENHTGPVHYIAHHEVLRPEKQSTPIRIVFNSSAKFNGHCLNDYWLKGPDLLNNLFGVILRFRENRVAICSDISKMYNRILIPYEDQHVHRFLWRNMKVDLKPDVYVSTVVTFGDKPAPAMAQIALRKTAEDGKEQFPQASETLKVNTYMDDICDSVSTVEEAKRLIKEIDSVLAKGGFNVKAWNSNKEITSDQDRDGLKLLEVMTEEKVLGTMWDQQRDVFTFRVNIDLEKYRSSEERDQFKLTKRRVLSQVARIFDPIGFAAPILIRAKIGIQRLWEQGLDWDQDLPRSEQEKWLELFQDMENLNDVSVERCLTPPDSIGLPTLCIFSDASEYAFGACAYARWRTNEGSYKARFIAAKSRVAPLKRLSIPRLELQAAVLATRLSETIQEEMRLKIDHTVFMSDSTIALAWIRSTARSFKPFVSARVSEIQSKSKQSQWRHIPGKENVADDVSRGTPVVNLKERWLNGPSFLMLNEEDWPVDISVVNEGEVNKERRKVKLIGVVAEKQQVIYCQKFSKWRRLVRVTAYVRRFIDNLKAKTNRTETNQNGYISTRELTDATRYWIKKAQVNLHGRSAEGEFKSLSLFTDEADILRVGGRLEKSQMSYENKHPALLPHDHHVSLLIMRSIHEQGHGGVATTVAKARMSYWILKAHRLAKTIKYRCVVCRETEHKRESQLMAELPNHRLEPLTPPFYKTACDYFGPYQVKFGRNKRTKHYGVIFTCMNTRAVHLEMAVDCSTMEFMMVLRRFFAIRGYPRMMISDNGTQMVGAGKELREMVMGWDKDQLKELGAEKGLEWKFITPVAPHQNGCAEALVKSCKAAIRRAIGSQVLSPFELYTVFLEVGNLVNQRPIGRVPNDPDDGSYLSPNQMLLGRASPDVPQGPFSESRNPRHRLKLVQGIVNAFWKNWSRDVLPSLVPRKKWASERRNVQVGDVVVMEDANAVRGKWTIGRIVDVFPGSDGRVRNVKIKTASGEYRRSITRVAVILPVEGYGD